MAVVAALAALAACGGGAVKPPPPSLGSVVDFTIPAAIRDLPQTEANGTTTTLAAYRGKSVMIADFLSLCTDICPMISANTAAVARALNADGEAGKVALLEISVDPQRDTPARLRAYQKLYGGPLSDWTLLRATPANAGPDVMGKLPPSQLVQFLDPSGLKALYHPDPVGDWTVSQGLQVFSWLTNHHLADPA